MLDSNADAAQMRGQRLGGFHLRLMLRSIGIQHKAVGLPVEGWSFEVSRDQGTKHLRTRWLITARVRPHSVQGVPTGITCGCLSCTAHLFANVGMNKIHMAAIGNDAEGDNDGDNW